MTTDRPSASGETEWAAWMIAANAGDAAAYNRLLRALASAFRPVIRGVLGRVRRVSVDAEDVVQEVLIAVHLKRHTWDSARPIGPWVRAIVRHKTLDALRRKGHRTEVPIEDFAHQLASEDAPTTVQDQDVRRSLDRLPDGQRRVIEAIGMEGASIAEAAARLEMTQGAVRVAFHRGLRALSKSRDAE